jgi:opacity protein-like surface antigen
MRLKPGLWLSLAFLFAGAASSAFAQSVPSATEAKLQLAVGAGFSGFNPDYGHGHLLGGTMWVDYTLNRIPEVLRGIGLEVEARDLNYGRSSTQPSILRQDVAGGGVIYSWRHFRDVRPYGKFLMGFGNADDRETVSRRYHDSRTVTSEGGGVEFRASRRVWVRVDYEYQFWPDFFKAAKPYGKLNPQGFTAGVLYHFSRPHFH